MKKLLLFFSSIFLFISCSSELEDTPEFVGITFSFSELDRTLLSSSNSNKLTSDSSQLSAQNASALTANQDPAAILITIINSNNEIVANNQRLTLFSFGNEFVTESINLETGNYEITSFSVLNDENRIIYATPVASSPLAELVETPLNISFDVSNNNTTLVIPDVIMVLDTDSPEQFGFVTFSFNVVDGPQSVTPTFQAFIQNGSLDEFTFNVTENSDAFDMTPPAGLQNNTGGFSNSPYSSLWNNTELEAYINANFGPDLTRPITTSLGNDGTRGCRLNSSSTRLYQLFNVEPGVEYTISIDSRSEVENTPLEIFILNNEITTEVDILDNSDASFTVTNDFNTNLSSFTTSEFSFIASSNIAVFYARSLNTVDSSTEVFIDNIIAKTPGFNATTIDPVIAPNEALIATWTGSTVIIPINDEFTYNYNIDWDNDGILDEFNITGEISHTYDTEDPHTIQITGDFPAINFGARSTGDALAIIDIVQWGTGEWLSMENAFFQCENVEIKATDVPNFSNVTIMRSMFSDAFLANPDVSNWDISNVTNMRFMFREATLANPDVSNWDTSNVTRMDQMFELATLANPDVSNWDTSNVTDMTRMFQDATSANPDVSNWDTSNVTNMRFMFEGATSANPDVSNWDTSNVTNMRFMFEGATLANPDVSNWDISNVTDMSNMFNGVSLTTDMYDQILEDFSSIPHNDNIPFDGGNSTYCNSTARDILINDGWIITDDGLDANCL